MEWAHAKAGPMPSLKAVRIVLEQACGAESPDGYVNERCHLSDQRFELRADSPMIALVFDLLLDGIVDHDAYTVHPRIAKDGADAVRAAMRKKAESELERAARALVYARWFRQAAEMPMDIEWPAYWSVESEAKLKGVR